jgi:hypothetical protein
MLVDGFLILSFLLHLSNLCLFSVSSFQIASSQDILTDYTKELTSLEGKLKATEKEKEQERVKHGQLLEVLRAHLKAVKEGISQWNGFGLKEIINLKQNSADLLSPSNILHVLTQLAQQYKVGFC